MFALYALLRQLPQELQVDTILSSPDYHYLEQRREQPRAALDRSQYVDEAYRFTFASEKKVDIKMCISNPRRLLR